MSLARRSIGAARFGVACIILVLFGVSLGMLFTSDLPEGNKEAIMLMIGSLGTALGTVVGFYFNFSGRGQTGG